MNFKQYNVNDTNLFPLVLSQRFTRILKRINDEVSTNILKLARDGEKVKESFIDITDKEDMISLISSDKVNQMYIDKVPNILEKCWTNNRNPKKIGRFVFSLLGDTVSATKIEDFVNEYKSIITAKTMKRNFRIVQGEEIRKWYLGSNYAVGGGNLKSSCMRHGYCQRFFDIYVHNPDKIKMLILLDESKEKILGRALLWYLDIPKDVIFMDRVYFANDFILNMFINYAIHNHWHYKLENMDNIYNVLFDNKITKMTMVVKVKEENYDSFPFIDNLGFYDPKLHMLSNNPKQFQMLGSDRYYDLCSHEGEFELSTDFDF